MKKTINVNLAGRIFYVEEDAYPVLDNYLKEVKAHFEKFEDSEEILKDIETRIAEQLTPEQKDLEPIVNKEAVEKVIASMGNPSDFTETEEGLPKKDSTSEKAETSRRFYRDTDNAILGGVSSGIAAHFDIDPLWIRLLFVVAVISGGWGILLYIILWIIIPAAQTPSQKMEMKGDKFTLKGLEQSVKENFGDSATAKRHARRVGGFIHQIVSAIGRFFQKFGAVIIRIIGTVLAIGFSLAIAGLVIGVITLAIGGTSPQIEFPLRDFFGNALMYIVLAVGFCIVFIPLLFGMLCGISLATLKSKFRVTPTITLLVLWIAALAIGAGIAVRNAPRFQEFMDTHPSFKQETTTRAIDSFTKLEVSNDFRVTLKQAPEYRVQIEATTRDQERIQTNARDGTLIISKENNIRTNWCIFCIHRTPRITITSPGPQAVTAENAVRITGENLALSALILHLSNASSATFENLRAGTVQVTTEDASRATLNGLAVGLDAKANNASRIQASELQAETVNAEANNASTIYVNARDQLIAKARNGSRIRYTGNPQRVEGNASRMEESAMDRDYDIAPTPTPAFIPTPTPPAFTQ